MRQGTDRCVVCWCVFMIKNDDYIKVKLPVVDHFDLHKRQNMIQS